jgi:hypothetical protein
MSMDVRISVPGLSREAAIALDRRADLTGGRWRSTRRVSRA